MTSLRTTFQQALLSERSRLVREALAEDLGPGDLTAALIPVSTVSQATICSREAAVLCGTKWASQVFSLIDPNITIDWLADDGAQIRPGQVICKMTGNSRALLTGERTALNFLQTLSATATLTSHYVAAVDGSAAKILDTRKTIPGFRFSQKYAVRCGGGHNHRLGLYDGILIKENHILAAGSIAAALKQARQALLPGALLEVEVESLVELEQALAAAAPRILLDNLDFNALATAVNMTQGCAVLEASGNVTLENITQIAATGVNYISVGSLTKNIQAVDLSMRII